MSRAHTGRCSGCRRVDQRRYVYDQLVHERTKLRDSRLLDIEKAFVFREVTFSVRGIEARQRAAGQRSVCSRHWNTVYRFSLR